MKKYQKANIEIVDISLKEIILVSGIKTEDSPLTFENQNADEIL